MLFSETVVVYCENHTEHRNTVRTSQETHYVSATEPSRLMLFSETVVVYCENHTEHRSRGSMVDTDWSSSPGRVGNFYYSISSRPALGSPASYAFCTGTLPYHTEHSDTLYEHNTDFWIC
jgi:hypothetical protein